MSGSTALPRAAARVVAASAAAIFAAQAFPSAVFKCDSAQSPNNGGSTLGKLAELDQRLQKVEAKVANKKASSAPPVFKFGLIADIQHADIDDATNFSGSEFRGYRRALDVTRAAVEYWNTNARAQGMQFIAQLGDLVDGQNAGRYGQGLNFKEPQSHQAVERILKELHKVNGDIPYLHAIGNHELYNFSQSELEDILGAEVKEGCPETPSALYYSLSPQPGWRIVMLNGFEQSTALPAGSKGFLEAEAIIHAHHPNAEEVIAGQGGVDYFAGLSGSNNHTIQDALYNIQYSKKM